MNDGVQQQTRRVDENMPLLALDQFARIEPVRIDAGPPSALLTLWLSMMQAVGLASRARLLAAFGVRARDQCDPACHRQCHQTKYVVAPCSGEENLSEGSATWQPVSGSYMTPLRSHRAQICSPLAAAAPRWRNERLDKRPLLIRQVAR